MKRDDGIRPEITELRRLLEDIEIAMLTTLDDAGHLHARPMMTQEVTADGELWFFTRRDSHKVAEVTRDQAVCLAYAHPEKQRYVSITGRADLVIDHDKIEALWNPIYKAWFPQGKEDPELALLRVRVIRAECWATPGGRMVQLLGFVKAHLTNKPAGEHSEQLVLRENEPPALH